MGQFWPPQPPRLQAGTVAGVSNTVFTSVSFPVVFSATPRVVATGRGLSANGAAHVGTVTTSGFQVALSSQSGGAISGSVDWIAIQS